MWWCIWETWILFNDDGVPRGEKRRWWSPVLYIPGDLVRLVSTNMCSISGEVDRCSESDAALLTLKPRNKLSLFHCIYIWQGEFSGSLLYCCGTIEYIWGHSSSFPSTTTGMPSLTIGALAIVPIPSFTVIAITPPFFACKIATSDTTALGPANRLKYRSIFSSA